MADKKISQLTGATTPVAGTEILPIVQSSTTKNVSIANLTIGRATETGPLTVKRNQSGTTTELKVENGNAGANSDVAHVFSTANGNWTVKAGRSTGLMTWTSANAIEVFKIANAGDTTVSAGNLVIGTAGKGIDFSANPSAPGMTSELLTYYETGTWTPTDTSGAGLTLTVNSAVYTRIGNVVTVQAKVTYPVTASALGAAVFGFPYAASSECAGAYYSGVAAGPTYYAITGAMYFANSAGGAVSNATLSGSAVIFNMTYKV